MHSLPQPYLLYTIAVPTQDQGRFMFGFRLKAKSEHEAALVLGWYGDGTGLVYPYVGVTRRARNGRVVEARQAEAGDGA